MRLEVQSVRASLPPAIKTMQPKRGDFERFVLNLKRFREVIDASESEENLKTHLMDFLKPLFAPTHLVEQQERIDFVIRSGGKGSPAAVLFETKRSSNKADMLTEADCNRKAMHEIVLHYMRERFAGNTSIQKLVVCTEDQFYVFDASEFERTFFRNEMFSKDYYEWAAGRKSDRTTEFFYSQIAKPFISALDVELRTTGVNLKEYDSELGGPDQSRKLLDLYRVLSPQNLLKADLGNDSNSLNRTFYDELLHLIGLEERKDGATRLIGRVQAAKRNPGSLIESVIAKIRHEDGFNDPRLILTYGSDNEDRAFNTSLELCLTWVNRLLFLKLLEAQVVRFHEGSPSYRFLSITKVSDFGELADLFFLVLALKENERPASLASKFAHVPYLNSSLFEKTRLEQIVGVHALNARMSLPLFQKTVLKAGNGSRLTGEMRTLEYFLNFLDSFDFGDTGSGELKEESRTIISASVLGLIFEKINGYREGAVFTPGYVTMFMSREVIEKTVLERFSQVYPAWVMSDCEDLKNYLTDRSKEAILGHNRIIDEMRICDPAVGSGHFLVSCLNELIALKSRLGILATEEGKLLDEYYVEVDNDELIILSTATDEPFEYRLFNGAVPSRVQRAQKTIFTEKRKLIENCLFGVDINTNSVSICQLRLWIELLKSAYYRDERGSDLETLPNIDINIKPGNSLLSRFRLDQNLSDAFNKAKLTVSEYRRLVAEYKNTKDREVKRSLQEQIERAKARFQEESLGNLKKRLSFEISELRAREAQTDLFVLGEEQEAERQEKLAEIREQIGALEIRIEKLSQDKTFNAAFEWRFEFPEVLDDKGRFTGFDIVIANPPYMRVQDIAATQPLQKDVYERSFSTAKGSYDLANLFFELAVRLSKADTNNNIFIFPHKLFNSANGSSLREFLMNSRAMKKVIHFGANQVFDNVITYTCIALFNGRSTDTLQFKKFALGEPYRSELNEFTSYALLSYDDIRSASELYGGNQWLFFDEPIGFNIFRKMYTNSTRLEERLSVFVGLQTSRDSLYVTRKISETSDFYTVLVNPERKVEKPPIETREFVVEKKYFRPFLMGKDVHRYASVETDRLVFFPYDVDQRANIVALDILEKNFPKTHDFVVANKQHFLAREPDKSKKLKEYYAYIYEKNLSKFDQEKLISMEICSSHPNITVNRTNMYHSTTVYSLIVDDCADGDHEFMLGILNSELFWWFLKSTGDTLQGDARRMKTNYINPFPLPERVSEGDREAIIEAVTNLLSAKLVAADDVTVASLEARINSAVFTIYGINPLESDHVKRSIGSF